MLAAMPMARPAPLMAEKFLFFRIFRHAVRK
jgi:hypothetical protein